MKKFFKNLAVGVFLALPWIGAASAQQANQYCLVDTGPPLHWAPCSGTNPMVVTPGATSAAPTNISTTTSGTPSTATSLLASGAHNKVILKVEGATTVCFSQFGTAVIGAAGTWCLKGASSANAGDGGSYSTPSGMTEPNAISMISTGTSVLVTGWWQ